MGYFVGYAGIRNDLSSRMRSNPEEMLIKIENTSFKELKLTKMQRFLLFFLRLIDKEYVKQIYQKIKNINHINKFDYVENKWHGHDPDKEFECQECGKIFERSNIKYNMCAECRGEVNPSVEIVKSKQDLPEVAFTLGEIRFVKAENCSYVYSKEGWIKIEHNPVSMITKGLCEDCREDINEFNSYIYIVDNTSHTYCSKCFIKHRKAGEKVNFSSTWGYVPKKEKI